jgi:hypothetical protein
VCILGHQVASDKQSQSQQWRQQQASKQEGKSKSLAAQMQRATIDHFLSEEHPPIRRVKMVGAQPAARVA